MIHPDIDALTGQKMYRRRSYLSIECWSLRDWRESFPELEYRIERAVTRFIQLDVRHVAVDEVEPESLWLIGIV